MIRTNNMELKISKSTLAYIGVFALLVLFIAFLSLPKPVPEGRLLKSERLVKLVNTPQIDFASPDEPINNLTLDAIVCPPDGRLVAPGEDCEAFLEEELEIINETIINDTLLIEINETMGENETLASEPITFTCYDSDAGIRPKKTGIVNVTASNGRSKAYRDKCINPSQIHEFVCTSLDSEEVVRSTVVCPKGYTCPTGESRCIRVGTGINKTVDCDSTIKAPVCGKNGETYLNRCFAEAAGVGYVAGICSGTGDGLIDGFDLKNSTLDALIKSGIGFTCELIVDVPDDAKNLIGAQAEKKIIPSKISEIPSHVATIFIHRDKFRYRGPYLDSQSNSLLYLDIIQMDKALYIFNPDNNKWLDIGVKIQLTDIPGISQEVGITDTTMPSCQKENLGKFLSNSCQIKDAKQQAACKIQTLDSYVVETCTGKNLSLCKNEVVQKGVVYQCKTPTLQKGSMICQKHPIGKNIVQPPIESEKTTVENLIALVKAASTPNKDAIKTIPSPEPEFQEITPIQDLPYQQTHPSDAPYQAP